MEICEDKIMINNLKIIEDDDDSIHGFTYEGIRYSTSLKLKEHYGIMAIFGWINITKIHMWNDKWTLEKEIECEERCQLLFKS